MNIPRYIRAHALRKAGLAERIARIRERAEAEELAKMAWTPTIIDASARSPTSEQVQAIIDRMKAHWDAAQ